jgi:hypothetical protein
VSEICAVVICSTSLASCRPVCAPDYRWVSSATPEQPRACGIRLEGPGQFVTGCPCDMIGFFRWMSRATLRGRSTDPMLSGAAGLLRSALPARRSVQPIQLADASVGPSAKAMRRAFRARVVVRRRTSAI